MNSIRAVCHIERSILSQNVCEFSETFKDKSDMLKTMF